MSPEWTHHNQARNRHSYSETTLWPLNRGAGPGNSAPPARAQNPSADGYGDFELKFQSMPTTTVSWFLTCVAAFFRKKGMSEKSRRYSNRIVTPLLSLNSAVAVISLTFCAMPVVNP